MLERRVNIGVSDPDLVGSADLDPDWESGSGSKQIEIGPPPPKKKLRNLIRYGYGISNMLYPDPDSATGWIRIRI
jgi:hypothetical protein